MMSDSAAENRPTAESWDTYWRGASIGTAYSSGGVNHPAIVAFWDEVFAAVKQHQPSPRILDVASGSGAVVERNHRAFGTDIPPLTCLDVSAGAVRAVTKRWAGVRGIVADARAIPLASGSIDVAASQFGVEYAWLEAIREILRLVARGGRIALLIHHRAGGI